MFQCIVVFVGDFVHCYVFFVDAVVVVVDIDVVHYMVGADSVDFVVVVDIDFVVVVVADSVDFEKQNGEYR